MAPLINRHVTQVAREYLDHFPCLIIEGARQVGKSTLAAQVADPGARVLNLDHEHVRAAAIADPVGLLAEADERQLVIDEIQRLPHLTLAVKAAIDDNRRPGRFILTGSSSLLRVRGTADSLAGRSARLSLYGLSQGEVRERPDDFALAAHEAHTSIPTVTSALDRATYARVLATGAYPELQDTSARIRGAWIEGYLQGVVGRDLMELRERVSPARSMAILRTLAGQQSAELVKATLGERTGVPTRTITGYVDLLHDVWLIASISPWTPNLAKREVGRSKTFVVDSAIAMQLARLTEDQILQLEYGEAFGALLEAFVAAELLRQRTWSEHRFDLYHYRERDGADVDLVLEYADGSVVGIEVKSAMSFNARQFRGLARLRDRLGKRFRAGIVLNTADAGYRYSDRLYGAPVSTLWDWQP